MVRGGFGFFGDTFPGTVAGQMAMNTPQLNSFTISNGKITPGVPGSLFQIAADANQSLLAGFNNGGTVGSITATNPFFRPPNFTTMDSPYKQARYEEFNLEVQHQLPWDMVASANFVGNHGYNLVIRNNGLNGIFPWLRGVGLPSTKPDPRFQSVSQLMTGAISNYRGMVLSLRRRMAQGLQFGFYYTYSHALDEVSNAGYNPYDAEYRPEHSEPSEPVQHSPVQLRQCRLRRTPLHFGKLRLGRHVSPYFQEARPESPGRRLDDFRNLVLSHRPAVHRDR